jgi:two-component system response regulator DesR
VGRSGIIDVLADAIRRVVAGLRVVDADLAAVALGEGANPLSAREREALAASHTGASIPEIARTVGLSEGTVRNHLSNATQKLGAPNRAAAGHIAERMGWLS